MEIRRMRYVSWTLVFLLMSSPYAPEAFSQNKLERQKQKQMRELPQEQLVAWTLAQAELLVAESEKTRADAQEILALLAIGDASSEKLLDAKVEMEVFRKYWQKKAERKDEDRRVVEQKLENRQLLEVERRSALTAQWESLFKPERMQIAKLKGTPQNLMLALLSEKTEISYSQSLPSGVNLKDTSAYTLNSDILNAIRVSSPTLSGPRLTFALTDPVPVDLTWLPTLLRQEDFAAHRDQIMKIRQQLAVSANSGGELDQQTMDKLENELSQMTIAFYRKFPPGQRKGLTNRQFHLIFQAEDFLKRLDRDVTAVVLNGSASPVQSQAFDRTVDGENVGSLVRWMLINNLRFEAPNPNDAGQYGKLFEMIKGFCVACDLAPNNKWVQAASQDLDLEVD